MVAQCCVCIVISQKAKCSRGRDSFGHKYLQWEGGHQNVIKCKIVKWNEKKEDIGDIEEPNRRNHHWFNGRAKTHLQSPLLWSMVLLMLCHIGMSTVFFVFVASMRRQRQRQHCLSLQLKRIKFQVSNTFHVTASITVTVKTAPNATQTSSQNYLRWLSKIKTTTPAHYDTWTNL